jgi:hypothetical protein
VCFCSAQTILTLLKCPDLYHLKLIIMADEVAPDVKAAIEAKGMKFNTRPI